MSKGGLAALLALLCLAASFASAAELRNGAQSAQIRIDPQYDAATRSDIMRWLSGALDAVGRVHGSWPSDRITIEVRFPDRTGRFRRTNSPVPWGQVVRGRGGRPDVVTLVVNPDRDFEALQADWTVYHELSHLLIPYRSGARWFTEGLASYYQNVVQARAGLFDENTLWIKLIEGFERGRRTNPRPDLSLSDVNGDSQFFQHIMRVYWTGALYWLEMDVRLRSEHNTSLDAALAKLKSCCAGQRHDARTIARLLDEQVGIDVFAAQYERFARTRRLPNYDALMDRLGVQPRRGAAVLSNDAEWAEIRGEIARGKF